MFMSPRNSDWTCRPEEIWMIKLYWILIPSGCFWGQHMLCKQTVCKQMHRHLFCTNHCPKETSSIGYHWLWTMTIHKMDRKQLEDDPIFGHWTLRSQKWCWWCFPGCWWLEHFVFHMLGMSSSQLTNSYFSEGWVNHQTDSLLPLAIIY